MADARESNSEPLIKDIISTYAPQWREAKETNYHAELASIAHLAPGMDTMHRTINFVKDYCISI